MVCLPLQLLWFSCAKLSIQGLGLSDLAEGGYGFTSISWDAVAKSFPSCKSCMWDPPDCLRVTVLVLGSFGSLPKHL